MGAFGELLIKRFGGNLETYRGNTRHESNLNLTSEQETETTEEDKAELRRQRAIRNATNTLNSLTTNLMYQPDDVSYYTEESIKNGFKTLGYNEEIQSLMWDKFVEFVSKYIKK